MLLGEHCPWNNESEGMVDSRNGMEKQEVIETCECAARVCMATSECAATFPDLYDLDYSSLVGMPFSVLFRHEKDSKI